MQYLTFEIAAQELFGMRITLHERQWFYLPYIFGETYEKGMWSLATSENIFYKI